MAFRSQSAAGLTRQLDEEIPVHIERRIVHKLQRKGGDAHKV